MAQNIPLQRLNRRQILTYIQNNHCSLDPSLNSQISNNLLFIFDKIYRCANGRILAVSRDKTGNLYESVNDWEAMLNELTELDKLKPVHILYNQVLSQDRFIQEIPDLISNLSKELEIDISELDKTVKSLLIVDRVIKSKNRQNYIDNNNKKVLDPLIAYIGEVIKTAINGEWLIKKDSKQEWEPLIISPSGKTFSFCIVVFDELCEAQESSFYDLTSMLIESHQR